MSVLAVCPDDEHLARVFYCCIEAGQQRGEIRHPQIVMAELAAKHSFEILKAIPQSLFDGWEFWIRFHDPPELPPFFRPGIPWAPPDYMEATN